MLKLKKYVFISILSLISLSAMAQRPTVRVTVEPSDILIGEQAIVSLEVISPLGRNIQFPVYVDTLVRGVEVLHMEKTDTTLTEIMTLNQKYIITSFDSTLYHIPYMLVMADGDSLKSNGFGLKVTAPELSEQTLAYLEKMKTQEVDSIDFAELQLADIKPIQPAPFVWSDYLIYIAIALVLLLLLCLLVVIYILVKNKTKKGYYFTPKIIEPAHIIALRNLDDLKAKKLSQQGQEKQYYTRLSDILRIYINDRYKTINAPEMITEDIIEAVHRQTDGTSAEEGLGQVLELADLVKFAKYTPLPNENDLSMVNAYLFVNQTKLEIVDPEASKIAKEKEKQAEMKNENEESKAK